MIAATGTRIATPEARSAWRIQLWTTKWTVARLRHGTLRSVGRLSIARSLRVALLGLALVLAVVAGLGVAGLYSARQDYEDRLANAYGLQASAGRLLAAGVVAEASRATAQAQRAQRAFRDELARARGLARGDALSERLVARAGAGGGTARAAAAALSARQDERIADARRTARHDTRIAVAVAIAGGILALLAALALVAALVGSLRRPLDELVGATGRLAAGDLGARVREDGPGELRALGGSFNAMAVDLEAATRRIESERARLDTTIRSLNDGLLVVGPDGTVEHANERACFLLPDPSVLPPAADALGREVTLEHDGRTLVLTAAQLAGDAGVAWTVRDATERARLEQLKSEFIATASHELRSPLTSIKGFIELLAADASMTDRQAEFVQIVALSTNRLVDLVNDLLDVARVEAGRAEVHLRPTDLREVVHEVSTLMRPRIGDKDQRLELDLPDELPAALADPARIRQVLTNLLTNAHTYSAKGGTVSVAARESGRHVALVVSDDGRGMTEEEARHAFDRFYRAGGGDGPGTGLGLAIVQSLVELHDGRVELETAPGQGSRFTVLIPKAPPLAKVGDGGGPREALRGKRVLVIDDEPAIAQLIATRLEPFEAEAAVAHSGDEALRRLRAEHFDAITLDILMPGMSGFEVLRALRADPELRGLPVVVVSVFSGHEALAGELVVSKPIDADELVDSLGAALLANRVRVLVIGRSHVRDQLEPRLRELGVEHEWATSSGAAARLCQQRHFEVALVDAGLTHPENALAALDLRGRRLRRSVVVFSSGDGDEAPGLARLDAEAVELEDAGATVLALLQGG
jgi:signal transduction histidine kinase/DNA-binding response OmpR family regulator/HAMP domain-containing protein